MCMPLVLLYIHAASMLKRTSSISRENRNLSMTRNETRKKEQKLKEKKVYMSRLLQRRQISHRPLRLLFGNTLVIRSKLASRWAENNLLIRISLG